MSKLEKEHDYIQWMFPTAEKSTFNSGAPDFPESVQKMFREDEQIRGNLRKSFEVFMHFLGLELDESGKVLRGKNFESHILAAYRSSQRVMSFLRAVVRHRSATFGSYHIELCHKSRRVFLWASLGATADHPPAACTQAEP